MAFRRRRDADRASAAVRPSGRARRALIDALEMRRLFAFGVTQTTGSAAAYVVDNGGDLKFSVLRPGASVTSTIHIGDVTSIKYKNQEMLAAYSVTSRYSHYEQGLGSTATVTYAVDNTAGYILVKVDDSAQTSGAVIQYYGVRRNDNNIYFASLPLDVNNGPGEGRFIAYLSRSVFSNPEAPSDNDGNTGAIEGSDVFGHADGTTTSKFFNMGRRMIENEYHGLTGNASGTSVGAWMYMGNREHSAGGPFFKDIDFQSGSAVEIYNCIFTGHTQTEPYRQGLHVYAMQFTNGSLPTAPDYSWLETARDSNGNPIQGLVGAPQRGAISGKATGNPAGSETVVTLSNSNAQYWDMADASGNYAITGVLPGTYTETMYRDEIAVGTRTVTITAGKTTRADLANVYYTPASTWRIGTWDGTPLGFLNSDKIEVMHPSDVRMSSWTSTPNFVVGTNTDADWPMIQFMGVNNSQRITFTLTAAQAAVAQSLRIGITLGFEGGRNRITVNAGQSYAWTSAIPAASTDLNSRGITRGTWRGPNQLYTYNIPTSALKAGVNTIDLPVVSGSYVAGQTWLSPNVVYDAIDLVPTANLTNAPVVSSLTISPATLSLGVNAQQLFAAIAKDQFGNTTPANVVWSAARGVIDDTGTYIAPATAGTDTITATVGSVTRTVTLSILDEAPVVATAAAASPSPAVNRKTTLSVLGADNNGESNLTYTWSVLGAAPGEVSFATNGSNAAKSTLATFSADGTYALRVTISDLDGNSTTSDVTVSIRNEILHYKADDTTGSTGLADSSGGNLNATLTGAYSFTTAGGTRGGAVALNGGYASLPSGVVAGLDDFTIATWVRADAQNTWSRIFDFGTGQTANMFLTARAGTTNALRFSITTSGNAGEQQLNGPVLATGVWTHVAITLSGNVGTMYVNGVAVASNANMTLHPKSLGTTTLNYLGKSQYADPAFVGAIDEFRILGRAMTAAEIANIADSSAPTLQSGSFAFQTTQSISLHFSEDVSDAMDASDITIQNLTTGTTIPLSEFTFAITSAAGSPTVATWTHNPAFGPLPDGNYHASVNTGAIADAGDNVLSTPAGTDFFVLAGDLDHDRSVNFNDLLTLAKNYGKAGVGYSQGNIDYSSDGSVDFNDLLALAKHYNATLAVPTPSAASLVAASGTASVARKRATSVLLA